MQMHGLAPQFRFDPPTDGGGTGTPDVAAMQAELDKFKSYGLTPDQLDAVIEDYVNLTQANKKAPVTKEAPVVKEPKKEAPKDPSSDKIRGQLEEMFPELKELSSVKDKLKALEGHISAGRESAFRDANLQADEHVSAYLSKELNVDADSPEGQKFIAQVGELVADAVYGRTQLLDRLTQGDARVVKEVLKEFKTKGLFDSMKIPVKKEAKVLPFQSSRNSPFKDSAAKIQEHLKTLKPHERLRAIGHQVFDQVIGKRED